MQLTITGFESPRHLLAIEQFVAAIRAANESDDPIPADDPAVVSAIREGTADAQPAPQTDQVNTGATATRKRRTKAEIEAARAAETTPVVEAQQPEPVVEAQQPEPQPEPEQAPSPAPSDVKVEKADVQKALSDLCAKTNMPTCQELLKKYGATAVRELKESDYAAFKAEADKLIAGAA